MSCNFSENYASVAGGAIKWNDRTIWVDEMTNFTSNWAVYGPDIGSYAICLIKVYEKKDYYENSICYNNQVGRGREIVTRFEM
jgi:predicted outer membrane repeat protein